MARRKVALTAAWVGRNGRGVGSGLVVVRFAVAEQMVARDHFGRWPDDHARSQRRIHHCDHLGLVRHLRGGIVVSAYDRSRKGMQAAYIEFGHLLALRQEVQTVLAGFELFLTSALSLLLTFGQPRRRTAMSQVSQSVHPARARAQR